MTANNIFKVYEATAYDGIVSTHPLMQSCTVEGYGDWELNMFAVRKEDWEGSREEFERKAFGEKGDEEDGEEEEEEEDNDEEDDEKQWPKKNIMVEGDTFDDGESLACRICLCRVPF